MLASIAVAATGQAMSPRRYSFESQVSVPSRSFHLPGSHKTEMGLKEGGRGLHRADPPLNASLGYFFLGQELHPVVLPPPHVFADLVCPLPFPSQSSYLASFGLSTGGDMAVLPEGQPRHFPEPRNPDPGPRHHGTGAEAGGHRVLSPSHPRPATR